MVKLRHTVRIQAPLERCFDLARSVEVHLLDNVHCGATAQAVGGLTSGLLDLGNQVVWRARHFYVWHNVTSEITVLKPPVYFQDTMHKGIFRHMQHGHYFRTLPCGETEMEDHFCFAAPIPILGQVAEKMFLRRYMAALLADRCQVIKRVAENGEWIGYLPGESTV